MEAVATSKADPAALPWQDAPAICRNTIKLVGDATRGWGRTRHWLHHGKVREAVFAVLAVALRLDRKGGAVDLTAVAASTAATAAAAASAGQEGAEATAPLPVLPIEMWIFMMRFFMRSWWEV